MLALIRRLEPLSRIGRPLTDWVMVKAPRVIPAELSALELQLGLSPQEWLDFQWGFSLLAGLAVGVVGESVTGAVLAMAGAWWLPRLWLKEEVIRRERLVLRSLPNTLDLLTACVEAGLTFDAAVAKVVEFSPPSIVQKELSQYLYEVKIGKPRRDAMKAASSRVDLKEFSTFISSVIQAEHLGTSLAEGLRIQAREIRARWRQSIEKQALEAPVKLLFPLTVFIFPTTFLIIFGPLLIRFLEGM